MRFYFHLILALLFFSLQQLPVSAGPGGREEAKPRYIFLFIGDGMGQGQCRAAEAALGRKLAINHMPVNGTTDTHNVNGKVTDSAAAGTAIACGARTKNGMLGLAPDGKALESVAAKAKKAGMKVGIITSVPLDHATPAAFYAHTESRNSYAEIARQLAESGFDFFAGEPLMAAARGNTEALARIKARGYRLVADPSGLDDKYDGKVCICKKFRRTTARDGKDSFTLARLTAAAISSLENENGFFIMVEGGTIDWACHQNDGALAVRETEEFDLAVRKALDFMAGRPGQCLVVVTADHETGGLAVVDPEKAPGLLRQKGSDEEFKARVASLVQKNAGWQEYLGAVQEFFGMECLAAEEEKALRLAWEERSAGKGARPAREALRIFNRRCGLEWAGTGHTGAPVITSASGVGADAFAGSYDNSEIGLRLEKLLPAGGK
ncbi:MAG: alkaline phosphatase [Kiritimatiellia bacterium]